MRRYIVSGAPGAGKTTVLGVLRGRGFAVVDEAATEVNVRLHAQGHDEAWRAPGFIEAITLLQRERLRQPVPAGTEVQLFDRSPVCTLALARYLGVPVPDALLEEVAAVGVYQPRVFFVRLLGHVTPTAVRRISYAETVAFERFHEEAYLEHGFELVDVPAVSVEERADLIEACCASW